MSPVIDLFLATTLSAAAGACGRECCTIRKPAATESFPCSCGSATVQANPAIPRGRSGLFYA